MQSSRGMRNKCHLFNNKGMTLIEVMVASGLSLVIFSTMIATLMAISSYKEISRSHLQAIESLKGGVERLKGLPFTSIVDESYQATYGAGPDATFGTADDLFGTMTVQVADLADMDNDGITAETTIDIDGDGNNDCVDDVGVCAQPYVKPIRVSFSWTTRIWGVDQTRTISADTLISR